MTKIFLYGTLVKSFPKLKRLGVADFLLYRGKAKMRGRMYDVGEYPAAVKEKAVKTFVYGELYDVLNEEKVIKTLDEFEEVDASENGRGLYIRKRVKVRTANGKSAFAWVYLYNQPLKRARAIPSGDYKKYLKSKDLRSKAVELA